MPVIAWGCGLDYATISIVLSIATLLIIKSAEDSVIDYIFSTRLQKSEKCDQS